MSSTGLSLSGKGAVVTGGGSGIGLACARALVLDGASVTLVGRTEEETVVLAFDLYDTVLDREADRLDVDGIRHVFDRDSGATRQRALRGEGVAALRDSLRL